MHFFSYKNNILRAEKVNLIKLASYINTPCYVYSQNTLIRHFQIFKKAFNGLDVLICYAIKANTNRAIIALYASLGGGADIVSGGELYRALSAGINPQHIIYSGVGKTQFEINTALKANILMFNLDNLQELIILNQIATHLGVKAPISIRINPNVDAKSYPYITTGLIKNKFGIDLNSALKQYQIASNLSHIIIKGISCHIGSQIIEVEPFVQTLDHLSYLIKRLRKLGIDPEILDLGGGLGIRYNKEKTPTPNDYANALKDKISRLNMRLVLEPGRILVGNAGILLTKVLFTKQTSVKNFIIVDAGMNDLIRPSFYKAYHKILPVKNEISNQNIIADIVGPICETSDFFARDRKIVILKPGDLIAIMGTGAYGFTMSSNYNSRPKIAEVLVNGNRWAIIRQRETYEDLIRGESLAPWMKKFKNETN